MDLGASKGQPSKPVGLSSMAHCPCALTALPHAGSGASVTGCGASVWDPLCLHSAGTGIMLLQLLLFLWGQSLPWCAGE